jgi:hypothetical protein
MQNVGLYPNNSTIFVCQILSLTVSHFIDSRYANMETGHFILTQILGPTQSLIQWVQGGGVFPRE